MSSTTNMKMCDVCINSLQRKKNLREIKKIAKTHLFNKGEKVECKICKSVYDTIDKEAHLQCIESNIKLLKCDVRDLSFNESSFITWS